MKIRLLIIALFFVLLPNILPVQANEGMRLSITPPLIKNNVNPGQLWKSSIKLINNNNQEIDIYVQLQDFKSGRENGTVEFLPQEAKGADKDRSLLSSWIVIEPGPIKIPPQGSIDIPFIIDVPETAGPGGHYAAILAGTRPPDEAAEGSTIKISSLLGSLMLLNVKGDVKEEGKILGFSSEKLVYDKPEVNFSVRFENTGNVHIQPQGEIRIYDWLSKDKGFMALNHETEFGNVLPGGVRKWDFNWKIADSPLAMGRYRAMLIVGFGNEARQTESREFYFWVLNFKLIGIVLGSLLLVSLMIVYLVRLSIRRAIRKTQEQVDQIATEVSKNRRRINVVSETRQVVDLKQNIKTREEPVKITKELSRSKKSTLKTVWKILATVLVISIIGAGAFIFFDQQMQSGQKSKQATDESVSEEREKSTVSNEQKDGTITNIVESEERETVLESTSSTPEIKAAPETPKKIIDKKEVRVVVLNGSGIAGLATKASDILTQSGYVVARTGNAASYNFKITEIRYKKEFKNFADVMADLLAIDAKLDEDDAVTSEILITLGKDFK